MKRAFLLLLLSTVSVLAGDLWPPVPFVEVRAYSWPAGRTANVVIPPQTALGTGAINEGGTPLPSDQVTSLRTAVSAKHAAHDKKRCYIPHNAFVFYDAGKQPVAFVEICFSCFRYRAEPKGSAEYYDLLALAAIFHELKLPLGEYPDLDAFKKEFSN